MIAPLVHIRPGRPEDAPAIARVHVETWRLTYAGILPDRYLVAMTEARQAAQWRGLLHRHAGSDTVLVAEVPGTRGEAGTGAVGTIVGFGSCGRARGGPAPGEVYTLYVAGDWQGCGVGRRLLGGLFRALVGGGIDSAFLWVLSANPSRFFYEAMGGRPLARRQERFAGAVLDEIAYGWPNLHRWLER